VVVAGIGVVAAVVLGAALLVRRRRAGQSRSRPRGRDKL